MKPNKTEIQAFQGKLQNAFRAVVDQIEDLKVSQAAADKFDREIDKIGEPDYRDDKAISRLNVLIQKRDIVKRRIDKIGAIEDETLLVLREVIEEGGLFVARILRQIVSTRFETVACALLQFSLTQANAEMVAKSTDACQGAELALQGYLALSRTLSQEWGYQGRTERCIEAAQKIEAVLMQALSENPDFLQFIRFAPGAVVPVPASAEISPS